jgi:hypothetical protein
MTVGLSISSRNSEKADPKQLVFFISMARSQFAYLDEVSHNYRENWLVSFILAPEVSSVLR